MRHCYFSVRAMLQWLRCNFLFVLSVGLGTTGPFAHQFFSLASLSTLRPCHFTDWGFDDCYWAPGV